MGGKGSGRKADPAKGRLLARLRSEGQPLREIGARLGLTPEGVRQALKKMGVSAPAVSVRCSDCGRAVPCGAGLARRNPALWCPRCLRERPGLTPAERLRSLRVAAGLTQYQLAERAGPSRRAIASIEQGQVSRPTGRTLARLGAVLGPGLLTDPVPG